MKPDQNQINEMDRLLKLFDEQETYEAPTSLTKSSSDSPSKSMSNEEQEMKRLLEKLEHVTGDAIRSSREDKSVKQLLEQDSIRTKNSIYHRGGYTVKIHETADGKSYDVIDDEGMVVANDLELYEVAEGIVKHLKQGKTALDSEIRQLIYLEGCYFGYKRDASFYHKKAKRAEYLNESASANLLQSKKDNSIDNAKKVRKQIKTIVNSI